MLAFSFCRVTPWFRGELGLLVSARGAPTEGSSPAAVSLEAPAFAAVLAPIIPAQSDHLRDRDHLNSCIERCR